MKQGWIQVDNNGGKEELAPKTIADLVYVDEERKTTVKDALAEGFVAVFTHTMSEAGGNRVHNFAGPSGFVGMGRALITEEVWEGEQIKVNGLPCDAFMGDNDIYTLLQGRWVTFVVDGETINFKQGGANAKVRVIGVASFDALPERIQENTVAILTTISVQNIVLGIDKPTSAVAGDVFIQTGIRSVVSFPLKLTSKEKLFVYPVAVMQHDGTNWVDRAAKFFQNGEWNTIRVYLYDTGVFYRKPDFEEATIGTITKNKANIRFYKSSTTGGYAQIGYYLDVTDMNYISARVDTYASGSTNLTVMATRAYGSGTLYASRGGVGLCTLDVRSVTGMMYVAFGRSNTGTTYDFTISEMYYQ